MAATSIVCLHALHMGMCQPSVVFMMHHHQCTCHLFGLHHRSQQHGLKLNGHSPCGCAYSRRSGHPCYAAAAAAATDLTVVLAVTAVTILFSQNWDISQRSAGFLLTADELADWCVEYVCACVCMHLVCILHCRVEGRQSADACVELPTCWRQVTEPHVD